MILETFRWAHAEACWVILVFNFLSNRNETASAPKIVSETLQELAIIASDENLFPLLGLQYSGFVCDGEAGNHASYEPAAGERKSV